MTAHDLHGLPLSTASPDTARAFNHAVTGYLQYRADAPKRLGQLMAADPEFAFGHVLRGYFTMLAFNQASVPAAQAALDEARRLAPGITARERGHVAALAAWVAGDIDATLAAWEQLLEEHPLDVLAFRLHHFVAFWHGRPDLMGAQADKAMRRWTPELAGYTALLACRCFAHEELGDYAAAEAAGRQAIEREPGDLWAAHGVAHVMEMQGRHAEGIAWLDRLEPHWAGGNNLMHHLWWHRALYHFERREFDEALALYDRRFRDLAAPITQAQPDLYIDVQNAASMLFRLQRQGVDVGDRWVELADKAEARIGDCLSAFTLPHWMMALTAAGRWEAAGRMLEAMRERAAGDGARAALLREAAVPIAEAVLARATGDAAAACEVMRPALARMHRLGGSHAQQDVLEQLFLDCAVKAGRRDDVRLLLERVAAGRPVAPADRAGYADAVRLVS
jgi:tetratricopeptide (TPR) repeat protein